MLNSAVSSSENISGPIYTLKISAFPFCLCGDGILELLMRQLGTCSELHIAYLIATSLMTTVLATAMNYTI